MFHALFPQKGVADVEAEREAWAAHFKQVSETRGSVHPRVGDNFKDLNITKKSKLPIYIYIYIYLKYKNGL